MLVNTFNNAKAIIIDRNTGMSVGSGRFLRVDFNINKKGKDYTVVTYDSMTVQFFDVKDYNVIIIDDNNGDGAFMVRQIKF